MLNFIQVCLFSSLLNVGYVFGDETVGYLAYCPCMGRFGNQADQFLGVIAFAKKLNRTLILPPWVEYRKHMSQSVQIPFDTYFNVEPLKMYTNVITMEKFMKELAPSVWPVGSRYVWCFVNRRGPQEKSCNAKDGNPFGSFWNNFDINFDADFFYKGLNVYSPTDDLKTSWNDRFPLELFPVLAFTGAPSHFPAKEEHLSIMQYLFFSDDIQKKALDFVISNLKNPYIGAHIRIGSDWANVCNRQKDDNFFKQNLFASAQCLGYQMEGGQVTYDICLPSKEIIVEELLALIKETNIRTIFIASDVPLIIKDIEVSLKTEVLDLKVVHEHEHHAIMDLAVLSRSNHFIGNCISTFSAFVTRYRMFHGNLPTSFWAFKSHDYHTEL